VANAKLFADSLSAPARPLLIDGTVVIGRRRPGDPALP